MQADGLELVDVSPATGRASATGAWRAISSTTSASSTSALISWRASMAWRSPGFRYFCTGDFAMVLPSSTLTPGIKTPKDLIGKRVGGTNFQPAGNIWLRGILEEHYGVPHQSITWVVDRSEDVEFTPPPGLKIEMIPAGKAHGHHARRGRDSGDDQSLYSRPIVTNDPRVAPLVSRLQSRSSAIIFSRPASSRSCT